MAARNENDATWQAEADVVVVGFGAAGACAALQAAEAGARVLLVDRFAGGGASRLSGGVLYLGGGTRQQVLAGFADDGEQMYRYLREEVGDCVSEAALREFCTASLGNKAWLEKHGIVFSDAFYPGKVVVPPDGTCLYYSGNEKQRHAVARPAPRGHRVDGPGMTGRVLFDRLRSAVGAAGIPVRRRTRVRSLISDASGAVVGVEATSLEGRRLAVLLQTTLAALVSALATLRLPLASPARSWLERVEARLGRTIRIRARRGVVLASGGFSYNRELVERCAPAFAPCPPIGTPGDDGAAIELTRSLDAATGELDRCAASLFIAPPEALVRGLLVDRRGERICDESMYGSTLGRAVAENGGRAWLVIDQRIWRDARQELREGERLREKPLAALLGGAMSHLMARQMHGRLNLFVNRRRGRTWGELAGICEMEPATFASTVERYNRDVAAGRDTRFGKLPEWCTPLAEPPFYAIDCSLANRLFLTTFITLGGVRVDGRGTVVRRDGTPIEGLFAAGRAAVGVSSRCYLSGLSLADCVHSGRRAGRNAAATGDGAATGG